MNKVTKSLVDLLGESYVSSVCRASGALGFGSYDELMCLGHEAVEFCPDDFIGRLVSLQDRLGERIIEGYDGEANLGAATDSFASSTHLSSCPLSGLGYYRIGEDGRLATIGKSEHYQASLGHNFPGYRLLGLATRIGITNVTHNNTRGFVTRLLERELIRVANGLERDDESGLASVLSSKEPHVLNRVINLETGSLACEAGIKMMLARFYRLQSHFPEPAYAGRTPVLFVMGDYRGGLEAGYHGTTVIAQILRGMWPGLSQGLEKAKLLKVVPVPINDINQFRALVKRFDSGSYKVAGFLHELVLMNYGGVRLSKDFVTESHRLCRERDIPVLIDEIQTGMWSPELLLFKEYGCRPDFVTVGKGFPGGQYPASKILTTAPMDNLNQFGALVTNGQEELASLSYLITMAFAEANSDHIRRMGQLWSEHLSSLSSRHSEIVLTSAGLGLLGTLFFSSADLASAFSRRMGEAYSIDVSAQTYKADCPPAALTKLPLICDEALLARIAAKMDLVLEELKVGFRSK